MINRILNNKIEQRIGSGKAIVVIGPRQSGKTTLINSLLMDKDVLFFNGDDPVTRELLKEPNTEQLKSIIKDKPFVFIDEAQRIDNIGLTLKLITDQIKTTQLFISGSSSFQINNLMKEPLTGRKWEYELYPVSWEEFAEYIGTLKSIQQLSIRLVYGMYPEVINHSGEETEYLRQLSDSYLYKDILSYSGIRKPEILGRLIRALAFQVGGEVSYREISLLIGTDSKTVASYISLLEQAFVVFKLYSFSRNLRNEIKTNHKIYFYDNGIMNMVKGNLNPLDIREDTGALWENFLISERIKKNSYIGSLARSYFWRTKQQKEIDYVEDEGGKITGFEFKWNPKAKTKNQDLFVKTYNADLNVIHSGNFRTFI